MECDKCKNKQYIGKSEWPMNFRINKHRDDSKQTNSIPICQHFSSSEHNFNRHARFTIIETLRDQTKPLLELRKNLESRENFWIKRMKTLQPQGFNQKLNKT